MFDSLPQSSLTLFWGFVVLPLIMAGVIVTAFRHTMGARAGLASFTIAMLWMGLTAFLGWSGSLDIWEPPRMFLVIVPMLIFLIWASRQPWTDRLGDLSLTLLVGFQSFRIAVELLLHQAVVEGVAHPTMTWSGTNWDIIPGVTALILAPFASRLSPRILQGWNVFTAVILVVTVVTSILATPSPFRQILGNPPNVFVAGFPFVWLPSVLVFSAFLGHIVLFKRLRRKTI